MYLGYLGDDTVSESELMQAFGGPDAFRRRLWHVITGLSPDYAPIFHTSHFRFLPPQWESAGGEATGDVQRTGRMLPVHGAIDVTSGGRFRADTVRMWNPDGRQGVWTHTIDPARVEQAAKAAGFASAAALADLMAQPETRWVVTGYSEQGEHREPMPDQNVIRAKQQARERFDAELHKLVRPDDFPAEFAYGIKVGGTHGQTWHYQRVGEYWIPVADLGISGGKGSTWDTNKAIRQRNRLIGAGLALVAAAPFIAAAAGGTGAGAAGATEAAAAGAGAAEAAAGAGAAEAAAAAAAPAAAAAGGAEAATAAGVLAKAAPVAKAVAPAVVKAIVDQQAAEKAAEDQRRLQEEQQRAEEQAAKLLAAKQAEAALAAQKLAEEQAAARSSYAPPAQPLTPAATTTQSSLPGWLIPAAIAAFAMIAIPAIVKGRS